MTDEGCTFEQTRTRLDEILVAVRKKDTSLEQSLEMLEEGVRLANRCNELIDQTTWRAPASEDAEGAQEDVVAEAAGDAPESLDGGEEAIDADTSVDDPVEDVAQLPDDERS
jgi:exodeoxyribonuclease VII small subunit